MKVKLEMYTHLTFKIANKLQIECLKAERTNAALVCEKILPMGMLTTVSPQTESGICGI